MLSYFFFDSFGAQSQYCFKIINLKYFVHRNTLNSFDLRNGVDAGAADNII